MGKRLRVLGMGCVAGLVLAGCIGGETRPAGDVFDTAVTFAGDVRNDDGGPTNYWFEYGTTVGYGSSTPTRSRFVSGLDHLAPVAERVQGLAEGTEYHFRLCARGTAGNGRCGDDQVVTTSSGRDSIEGSGYVYSNPAMGALGGNVMASDLADGSDASGTAGLAPGLFDPRGYTDYGPVTCLRVEGNRAAIGFIAEPPPDSGYTAQFRVFFIEDNGPTGDRIGISTNPGSSTVCPTPTAADFPIRFFPGFPQYPIDPTITSGDFTIHDHSAAP